MQLIIAVSIMVLLYIAAIAVVCKILYDFGKVTVQFVCRLFD